MYKHNPFQMEFEDFFLPFGGKLPSDNRWIKLAKLIPWDRLEKPYKNNFATSGMGAPALPARVAFGALIIKEKLGTSDEETVEQIKENPFLQFFLGYGQFENKKPFDPSMMVHFRKRFSPEILQEINACIVGVNEAEISDQSVETTPIDEEKKTPDGATPPEEKPQGKLMIDATCTPADIRYPTDLSLLNEAREKTEEIIDVLHTPLRGKKKKPRSYRQVARAAYLLLAKAKKLRVAKRRVGVGQQLRYVKRNLESIDKLMQKSPLSLLSKHLYRSLLVIHELYRQQEEMYRNKTHQVSHRIVSIFQPHVRPIVRGKAKARTEFGAKITLSRTREGYSFLERLEWENYNEALDLQEQVERYRTRFGYYPASVHVDRLYRTRANRSWCKARGIRISGIPLGRPGKSDEAKAQRKQAWKDECERNAIDGDDWAGQTSFQPGSDQDETISNECYEHQHIDPGIEYGKEAIDSFCFKIMEEGECVCHRDLEANKKGEEFFGGEKDKRKKFRNSLNSFSDLFRKPYLGPKDRSKILFPSWA